MPSECVISFDREDEVYYSGQNLNTFITLTTTSHKIIRGISVTLTGYGKVRWMEDKSRKKNGKSHKVHIVYSTFRSYLNYQEFMLGTLGGDQFDLPPGTYDHKFSHQLPMQLPTSLVGRHGVIKYEIVVLIDRPFRYNNLFKKAFTVIHEQDLNINPSFRQPKSAQDTKEFCCTCNCFGGAGTVFSKLSIPYLGYAPGQKIKFTLLILNESASSLPELEVILEKRVTFESKHPTAKQRHSSFILDNIRYPKVLRHTTKEFEGELLIPSVPPSSTYTGACVRIEYSVYATVQTGCCHSNLKLVIPFVIGTIPLIENAITSYPEIIAREQAKGITTEDDVFIPLDYKFAVSPSHEYSTASFEKFVDEELDDKHKVAPYIPKYPVYHNVVQPISVAASNGNFVIVYKQSLPSTSASA